ncbi:MAG TPA: hypothetical protein V6D18_17445 [Thermosynechococcaceae cyanobacterium]
MRQAIQRWLGFWLGLLAVAIVSCQPKPLPTATSQTLVASSNCDPSYPDFCIPPPPPDLDCKDIKQNNFRVLPPDPHRFDRDKDGIGCESKR